MEKKFKFSDKSAVSKIVYITVIAILCVSAIVIGIVASNSRKGNTPEPELPGDSTGGDSSGGNNNTGDSGNNEGGNNTGEGGNEQKPEVKLTFVSPVVGTVIKSHSTTVPVFSVTLDEWRIHTGLDISTEESAEVFAAADGTVTTVQTEYIPNYDKGMYVIIDHGNGYETLYSHCSAILVREGDTVHAGDVIAQIGNTGWSAGAHLHFELRKVLKIRRY